MKFSCGFWIPDNDDHFVGKGPTYQKKIRDIALSYVGNWGLAIDIGAHCGFWSNVLARHFTDVAAFEPQKENIECLSRNAAMNITLFPYALGDKPSRGILENPAPQNSGAWVLNPCAADGNAIVRTLDSFNFSPGLIKVDVQGYEEKALRGAETTLKINSPVMVVEDNGDGAVKYLETLGYNEMARINRDVVMIK